jgi:hypothetical protein
MKRKVTRTAWRRGKGGDDFKALPIPISRSYSVLRIWGRGFLLVVEVLSVVFGMYHPGSTFVFGFGLENIVKFLAPCGFIRNGCKSASAFLKTTRRVIFPPPHA